MYPNRRGLGCPEYVQLIPKKKAKSPVWAHFGFPANESGQLISENLAVCKLCRCPVSVKGGSTTNLLSHLKLYHPVEYANINSINRQTQFIPTFREVHNVDGSISASEAVVSETLNEMPLMKKQKTLHDFQPLNSNSEKLCTNAVTKFVATTMQPYNIVESQLFIEMIKTLNPRYKLPGRKVFSQTAIPKLYNETKETIKREIGLIKCSDVSITTDCWTSVANIPYIAVTAHFIDAGWILKSACLNCVHFDEDHTADNIRDVLTDILSCWNLNVNQLCSCTTDNGANILKAVSFLDVQHIPCFGHTINIGINRALQIPVLQRTISKLKKLQSTISHSWKMSRDLVKAQELLQMEVVKLPSACPTRWWSILKLCHRFLQNQLPICKLLQDYSTKKHLMLEANEVSVLEHFVSATKLLEAITKNLSGEDYTTASSVLPLLTKIKKNLEIKETDSNLLKKIKEEILSALIERYYENEGLMYILRLSMFCDSRFRLSYVENSDEIRDLALSYITKMYDADNEFSILINGQSQQKIAKKGLAKILDDKDESMEENIMLPSRKAENELNSYLAMPKVDLNQNPLTWWKLHESSFPALKILAKKFLAIQATRVSSERVFSTGGSVINKNRAALLPKNAEMQVFLTQNKCFI